jgi:hypothetical protein
MCPPTTTYGPQPTLALPSSSGTPPPVRADRGHFRRPGKAPAKRASAANDPGWGKKRCQRPNLTSSRDLGKTLCMSRASRYFPGGMVYHVLSGPLRGTQCPTCESGGADRGVALVEPSARGTRGSVVSNSFPMAAAAPHGLAGNREPSSVGG